jgi:hypothetical protein
MPIIKAILYHVVTFCIPLAVRTYREHKRRQEAEQMQGAKEYIDKRQKERASGNLGTGG